MKARHTLLQATWFLAAVVSIALAAPAAADEVFSREEDITDLRLGQRVLVDDGSCPPGQIKEVAGSNLTPSGVTRARQCVARLRRK